MWPANVRRPEIESLVLRTKVSYDLCHRVLLTVPTVAVVGYLLGYVDKELVISCVFFFYIVRRGRRTIIWYTYHPFRHMYELILNMARITFIRLALLKIKIFASVRLDQ